MVVPNTKLEIEGELKVVETSGAWGVYAGERVLIGSGQSFRDDLGMKIREMFDAATRDALATGTARPEAFSLPRVRATIEVLAPGAAERG
jgi:hypothetical protein